MDGPADTTRDIGTRPNGTRPIQQFYDEAKRRTGQVGRMDRRRAC